MAPRHEHLLPYYSLRGADRLSILTFRLCDACRILGIDPNLLTSDKDLRYMTNVVGLFQISFIGTISNNPYRENQELYRRSFE